MEDTLLQQRIRARLAALKLKPIPAATNSGLQRDFIRDILTGRKKNVGFEGLAQVAFALECDVEYLTNPDVTRPRRDVLAEAADLLRGAKSTARGGSDAA